MRKDIIVHESPKAPISESIRLLRTNISFMCKNRDKQVLLVTSAVPGDGKSWVSANLAIAYAQTNKKVLLIDSDLRKGRQHKIFGKFNSNGFSDYLLSVADEENLSIQEEVLIRTITTTDVPNLFLIPSGTVPPNPAELLDTQRVDDLIKIAKQKFDIIIFDMPPVNIVTDSLLICKKVDYTILVAAAEKTKKDMVLNAKKAIEHVGGKIAGVVLNKMPIEKRKEYSKYYSHYGAEETSLAQSRKRSNRR